MQRAAFPMNGNAARLWITLRGELEEVVQRGRRLFRVVVAETGVGSLGGRALCHLLEDRLESADGLLRVEADEPEVRALVPHDGEQRALPPTVDTWMLW